MKHTHKCCICGHEWECSEPMKKNGVDCEGEVEKAAKINGTGPYCNFHLHLEMARRYGLLRGIRLHVKEYTAGANRCAPWSMTLEEAERQAILLALAELSIARPGWVNMLERIALKMDNRTTEGKAEMFEAFRLNHSNPVAQALGGDPA